jgi:hypothetical protein
MSYVDYIFNPLDFGKITYVVLRTFNLIKVNGKQIEAINLLMTGLLAVSTFI